MTSGAVTFREYRDTDAVPVAALLSLVEAHAGGHAGTAPDDVRAMAAAVLRDARLGYAPDGTLVAAALNLLPPPGGFRFDALGGVHPDWRGRGLGRRLLGWQLRRAAALHRMAAADQPWEVRVRALAGDTAAIRLYQRLGLRPVRHWLSMTASITATGRPTPLPHGVRTVPYSADLEHLVHATHMAAFTDHWRYQIRGVAEWASLTVRSAAFAPDLSLVALDGEGVAGYLLSYHGTTPERLILGQAGVLRGWRGRGLGSALLVRGLARAAAAGKRSAGLVTDADNPSGAVTVSTRYGFTVESRAVTYAITVPPPHSP